MNWPDTQGHKRGHSKTDNKKEHQDGLEPPKKRTVSHDNYESPASLQSRRVSLDQQKLEARRTSNRLSAQRCRLRQKTVIKGQEMTIRELETDKASLKAANITLYKKLNEALHQNEQLRRMMEGEVKVVLDRNLSLQRYLERRIERQIQEESRNVYPREMPPPLIPQASVPGSPADTSLRPSHSVQEPVSDRMNDLKAINSKGDQPPHDASANPPHKAILPPHSPDRESGQDDSVHANVQDGIPANVRIQYLQQEIEALKKKVQEAVQRMP